MLQRIRIILFFLLVLSFVKAEGPLRVVGSSSMLFNYRRLGKTPVKFIEYRNSRETYLLGNESFLGLSYRFDKSVFVEVGVAYAQKGYKIKEDLISSPYFSPLTVGYNTEEGKYNYDYISVPLRVGYQSQKYKQFYVTGFGGLSFLIPLANSVQWDLYSDDKSIPDKVINRRNYYQPPKFDISLDGGLGFGYSINKYFNVEVIPTATVNIVGDVNNDIYKFLYGLVGTTDNPSNPDFELLFEEVAVKERLYNLGVMFRLTYCINIKK